MSNGQEKRWLQPLAAAIVCILPAPAAWSAQASGAEADHCRHGPFWHDKAHVTPAFPGQTRAPPPAARSSYRVEIVASGLSHPWSLAFLPDGRMLVTEVEGSLRIVDGQGSRSEPLQGLPPLKKGPPGALWDIVLDPDFEQNRFVYFNYFSPPGAPAGSPQEATDRWEAWLKLPPEKRREVDEGTGHVVRARLAADGRSVDAVTTLVDGVMDGRLRFLRDGTLTITSGTPASVSTRADREPQDLQNAYGKILRIRADGSVPPDNPFAHSPGLRHDIWALGLRDPQGAAVDPGDGSLWTSEHGPRGGDAIHRIRPGDNFGYPIITYGREYSGALINSGLTSSSGLVQPYYFWNPDIGPSGMVFYRGSLFPSWRGNLFVAALAAQRIERLVLDGEHVVAEESLLQERCERMRAVYEGPEGALYVLTDEDNAQILRVIPLS